jgi:predicted dehydrogenase
MASLFRAELMCRSIGEKREGHMSEKTRVGIVGCGAISDTYISTLQTFRHLAVIACADIDPSRSRQRAAERGIARCTGVEELLAAEDVDIVVNLTPPKEHYKVSAAALAAGKNVYSEKPLAVSFGEGKDLIALARRHGKLLGCAPDTFLGAGLQTSLKLIADGWIGRPVAAAAFMMRSPPEYSNPGVTFIYEKGAGPLFDMGPYYLTALVVILGPIRRVSACCPIPSAERFLMVGPNTGQRLAVETPTHVASTLEFQSGAVATLVTSFDIRASGLPDIEVYGSDGTISVPDPNTFGGPVRIRRADDPEWTTMPLCHRHSEETRGLGVAEMAHALQNGQKGFRTSAELACHVLEAMHGILASSDTGRHYEMQSRCAAPGPLPVVFTGGVNGEMSF